MKHLNTDILKTFYLFVILSLCSIAANASVLNFNGFGSTGTVSYSQDAGPNQGLLVGSNIDIGLISGSEGTTQDGLLYDCVGCKLNLYLALLIL